MGTTLTGTTPQDTYDSLIKVTDNGPLSGTLKALSDGLGNDSTLSLSTTAASVAGTLTVMSGATFSGTTAVSSVGGTSQMRIDRSGSVARIQNYDTGSAASISLQYDGGNVGIGTSNPTRQLSISATNPQMVLKSTTTTGFSELYFGDTAADNGYIGYAHNGDYMYFGTNNSEKLRILLGGGITFNGDATAANALDDYEEGTWTMGVSFGGASVGVTYSANTGTYTKVGRKVTANGFLALSSKGSSSGTARITGLPFTIASGDSNYSAPSVWLNRITFANQFQAYGNTNATTIDLSEITSLGVLSFLTEADFANNSEIMISFTYFV